MNFTTETQRTRREDRNPHNEAAKAAKVGTKYASLWPLRSCCEHPVFGAFVILLCK
jgi:hypothetical protein